VDDQATLTFASAAELYIADLRALGRLTTERSAHEYRRALLLGRVAGLRVVAPEG
jgi:hypothetical protein